MIDDVLRWDMTSVTHVIHINSIMFHFSPFLCHNLVTKHVTQCYWISRHKIVDIFSKHSTFHSWLRRDVKACPIFYLFSWNFTFDPCFFASLPSSSSSKSTQANLFLNLLLNHLIEGGPSQPQLIQLTGKLQQNN